MCVDIHRYFRKAVRVFEFEKAGMTTHPHAVGSGRENSARMKLKNILPAGVGIGSGFVIDSYGNTSQQCDIMLFVTPFVSCFVCIVNACLLVIRFGNILT